MQQHWSKTLPRTRAKAHDGCPTPTCVPPRDWNRLTDWNWMRHVASKEDSRWIHNGGASRGPELRLVLRPMVPVECQSSTQELGRICVLMTGHCPILGCESEQTVEILIHTGCSGTEEHIEHRPRFFRSCKCLPELPRL